MPCKCWQISGAMPGENGVSGGTDIVIEIIPPLYSFLLFLKLLRTGDCLLPAGLPLQPLDPHDYYSTMQVPWPWEDSKG